MVRRGWPRRDVLALLAASVSAPHVAWSDEVIDLDWEDLLPEGAATATQVPRGLIRHDDANISSQQTASSGVRTDWNGRIVRLPGFVVPIDHVGAAVSAFILVPFVGACVHVPPPPANQLVFVTTEEPFLSKGLFSPVKVTGMFGTSAISTQLAQIGYALSAEVIEPFNS